MDANKKIESPKLKQLGTITLPKMNMSESLTEQSYLTKLRPVTMEEINKLIPEHTKNDLLYMTEMIGIYLKDEYPTELVPYLALLLVDLENLQKMFPIHHKPAEITENSIEEGFTLGCLDLSKKGYILTIAYQQILESTYGGMSGKSVANLKKWIGGQRNIPVEKVTLDNYDVGAIVTYLNLIESKDSAFSVNTLHYVLGLFDDFKPSALTKKPSITRGPVAAATPAAGGSKK